MKNIVQKMLNKIVIINNNIPICIAGKVSMSRFAPSRHTAFDLVKTIARAHRDLCVLAVLLCCIMQSIFDAN